MSQKQFLMTLEHMTITFKSHWVPLQYSTKMLNFIKNYAKSMKINGNQWKSMEIKIKKKLQSTLTGMIASGVTMVFMGQKHCLMTLEHMTITFGSHWVPLQ